MPDFSHITQPGPYHILAYGTALGSNIFQSFVAGVIAFKTLPRPQFSTLQKATFPVYFAMQTALPVAMMLSFPGTRSLSSPSLSGIFDIENRWSALVPMLTMAATGALNAFVVGPWTVKVMKARKHQETRDGKKAYDPAPHSKEMVKLNRQFGYAHGASTLINLAGLVATIVYGFALAERLH